MQYVCNGNEGYLFANGLPINQDVGGAGSCELVAGLPSWQRCLYRLQRLLCFLVDSR